MKKSVIISIIFLLIFGVSAMMEGCRKSKSDYRPTFIQQEIPDGFPQPNYRFQDNPLTQEGFELGRRLFYEGRLSKDGYFPCASCHQQFAGFTTYDHDLSHGYNNSHTTRNAPGLFNLAWQKAYQQDGGYDNLEDEAAVHILAMNEMAETFPSIIAKLSGDSLYPSLFRSAFGTETINRDRILKALAQFTGFITSANSKYDRFKKGQATFNAFEQRGYTLFQTNCAGCHPEPLFTDFSYRNIGLPIDPFLRDFGRMRITGDRNDSLKFRVPTLRNVYLTSYFMHDGRFPSIQQCINHYRSGIQQGPTLDPSLQNGITLTNAQVIDLVEFLKTLTDSSMITDQRFARPN